MARSSRSRSLKRKVDFSGVEGRIVIDEGRVRLKVEEVTLEEGDRAEYYKWKFVVPEGEPQAGGVVYYNTSLAPQALWNLKQVIESLGFEVEGQTDIDPEEFIDAECEAEIVHERYQGRIQAHIGEFYPVEEVEEEDTPKRGRKAKDEDDDEEAPPKRGRGRPRKESSDEETPNRGRRRAAAADDEEDEDEAPRRGRKAKKEEPPEDEETLTTEDINGMSEDELQDLVSEHDLDVELSDYKSLRKMRAAVIDAAEEAGIIE